MSLRCGCKIQEPDRADGMLRMYLSSVGGERSVSSAATAEDVICAQSAVAPSSSFGLLHLSKCLDDT